MSQREHIIREATNMFIAEGLRSIRMDDIAERLRVSKRTLYELFGDKQTLIRECIMCNHHTVLQRMCEVSRRASNSLEEIILMLQVWDDRIEQRYELMVNLHRFYPEIHKSIIEQEHHEGLPLLKAKLEEAVGQGFIVGGLNFDLALKIFMAMAQSVMTAPGAVDPVDISRLILFRKMTMFFLRSMATENGVKIIDKYLFE